MNSYIEQPFEHFCRHAELSIIVIDGEPDPDVAGSGHLDIMKLIGFELMVSYDDYTTTCCATAQHLVLAH